MDQQPPNLIVLENAALCAENRRLVEKNKLLNDENKALMKPYVARAKTPADIDAIVSAMEAQKKELEELRRVKVMYAALLREHAATTEALRKSDDRFEDAKWAFVLATKNIQSMTSFIHSNGGKASFATLYETFDSNKKATEAEKEQDLLEGGSSVEL